MQRRDFLQAAGLAAVASSFPLGYTAAKGQANKKLLFFTRSQNFQHDVVNRSKPDGKKFLGEKGKLAHAEYLVTEWGKKQWDNYNPTEDGDYTGACTRPAPTSRLESASRRALPVNSCQRPCALVAGRDSSHMAAMPATCGVAMLVPDIVW